VKFNPRTTSNTFASASRDGTIKVDYNFVLWSFSVPHFLTNAWYSQIWSIHSDTPITTLECEAELTSVHYLSLPGSHQHIVTGSSCGTARVSHLPYPTA
jgi:WD40 repeat protein